MFKKTGAASNAIQLRHQWLKHLGGCAAYGVIIHPPARDRSSLDFIAPLLTLTLDLDDAKRIIQKYVNFYNSERLHAAIGYVAPDDHLNGRTKAIHAARDQKRAQARERRKHYSQNKHAA